MKYYAAVIDIGGTSTRIALIDEQLQIVKRVQFLTIISSPDATIAKIKEIIEKFSVPVIGAGVSCPGPLDVKQGIVLTPPNLVKWHYIPIRERMEQQLRMPIFLENDANLACLGEAKKGAGKGCSIVQYLTISTGIGSGFVVDGDIYQGAHGFAHEIANMIVWKDGPSSGDLKAGSIESIASGTAITQCAIQAGCNAVHAGDVHELAMHGNHHAMCIMEDAKEYLANTIAALFAINDPDIIVLGGSVALKIPGFVEEIEWRVKEKVYENLKDYVHIVRAQLDDDCGLIGAACLVFTGRPSERSLSDDTMR